MSEPVSRRRRTIGRASVRRAVPPRAQPRPALPRPRGVAKPFDTSTRPVPRPEVTGPIFVDHSGRRARVLRRIGFWAVAVALLLLALLWLSQASVIGLP